MIAAGAWPLGLVAGLVAGMVWQRWASRPLLTGFLWKALKFVLAGTMECWGRDWRQ